MADVTVSANVDTMMGSADNAAIVNNIGGATSTGTGGLVRATSPTLVTPALGTPSALVLTNATGLPVAGGGTGASTLTGILKGNGTSAFTAVTAPSGTIVGDSDTITLTNKRITARVQTAADATSITPTGDSADIVVQTNTQSAGTLTINAPTGTPTEGQTFILKIKSTNVQTFSWNAVFRGGTDIALPTVTTAAKTDRYGFRWCSIDSKWDIVAVARGY